MRLTQIPCRSQSVHSMNYIDRDLLSIDNTDLRRKLRRKQAKKKSGPVLHVDKQCHAGRTYAYFQEFLRQHPTQNVCEMSSFDELSQEAVHVMMNHINSMPRGSLNARASIQLFVELYGKEAAAKLGLKYIPFDQLCLKPNLLTK